MALDISKTRTGLAVDHPGKANTPLVMSFSGGRELSAGRAGLVFNRFLSNRIKDYRPDLVVVEAPAVGHGDGIVQKAITTEVLFGLVYLARVIAARDYIRFETAHVQRVRKTFMGVGRPPDKKRAVVRHCADLGWPVANADEADAVALWYYGKMTWDRECRLPVRLTRDLGVDGDSDSDNATKPIKRRYGAARGAA